MGDYNIRTVKDFILAVQILQQESREDVYESSRKELSNLAKNLIFRARRHQLTGPPGYQGRREYRLNSSELIEHPDLAKAKELPVVLVNPEDYELGPFIHVSLTDHLDDEVAA